MKNPFVATIIFFTLAAISILIKNRDRKLGWKEIYGNQRGIWNFINNVLLFGPMVLITKDLKIPVLIKIIGGTLIFFITILMIFLLQNLMIRIIEYFKRRKNTRLKDRLINFRSESKK